MPERERALRLSSLYAKPEPTISFEYFPPKNAQAEEVLVRETTPALLKLKPAFISITYGAGGGTRDTTLRIADRLRRDYGVEPLSHLTCTNSTRDQLSRYLDEARACGLENILALRGDPPKGESTFQAVEGGFSYATDLIRFVKSRGDFCIAAACYPEGHVESANKHVDWDHAAEKVALGAEFLISQLFYDWSDFLDMVDYLRNKRQVKVPIIPGILPFLTAEQIKRFTSLCGSKLMKPLRDRLEAHASDDEAVRQIGVDYCTEMCRKLLDLGVPGFHFYCLNRAPSCTQILKNLGLA
jgi:methylenetetrahydrofolate reductase (NADPH)